MHYCTKFNNYIYVVTCIAKFLQLSAHCGEKEGKKYNSETLLTKLWPYPSDFCLGIL